MRASDILMATLALVMFAGFLGVLIWKVPSPPLIVVCVFGVALGAYDFIRTGVRHRSTSRSRRVQSTE